MNHTFVGSMLDASKCRQCNRTEKEHTDEAECESCGRVGPCEVVDNDILLCELCQARDAEIKTEIAALPQDKNERINVVRVMAENNRIEQSIKILPDIFNAKMKAIVELQQAIDGDATIENKSFHMAKVVEKRIIHLRGRLIEVDKERAENLNEQRAIQQYYNELAKKLRAEEREQISINDLTYKPAEPKKISKPKSPSTKSIGTKETIDWANKLEAEFPEAKGKVAMGIQTLLVVKTAASPEAAYNILRGIYQAQRDKKAVAQ